MSRLSRSQSSFVPNGSSRCQWASVAPLTSTPVTGFAPQKVARIGNLFCDSYSWAVTRSALFWRMLNRFELECFALTRADAVLRHFEAIRVTAIQIGAKNFKLIHLGSRGTGLCSGKEEFCLPTKLHGSRFGSLSRARPWSASSTPSAYSPAKRGTADSPHERDRWPSR